MTEANFLKIFSTPWIVTPSVFILWVTILLILKAVLFKTMRTLADKTKTQFDDILIRSLDFPLTLLILTSGGIIMGKILPIASGDYFVVAFKTATIIAVVLFVDRFFIGILREYSTKVEILRTSGAIAQGFVRLVVIGLGLLILLDSLGVSITPILASLGIGSLAVALALQPTLENFFAGVQILVDKPIQPGQFAKLESGEEGYVHKMGWRSTWIYTLSNNMVVVPNKLVVNSKIMNYYYPNPEVSVLVEVGVHYHSDLDHVERITIEVARETLKAVPGAVKDFEPSMRYHTFAASNISFTVILRGKEIVDQYLIKHEFIKRLHKRYAKEGVLFASPLQVINLEQEQNIEKLKG